jgi:predicted transcriptional regulator
MTTLDEWLAKRPVDRERVDAHKVRMLADLRAHKLRELREALELTQVDLAEIMKVSQNSVSKLERGELEHAQIETLRRYIEAIGGSLHLVAALGDERIRIG